MKKVVGSIIGILMIITIGVVIYFQTNKSLTKEEYLEVTKKVKNVQNAKIESDYLVIYIKDGVTVTVRNDGIKYWSNENTKEYIIYKEDEKKYSNQELTEENLDREEYKFVKYTRYRDVKCAVVEYKWDDSICKEWIDLETGIVMKSESTNSDQQKMTIEYKVTYNCVTDKDVEKPDLTEYTEFEENI